MPDVVRYELRGPRAGEPIAERSEIEWLARACRVVGFRAGLDSTVIETRFTVVRSGVPHRAVTIRRLRDYLPPLDHRDALARSESVLRETA